MSSVVYYPGYNQIQVTQNYLCQQISAITNANPMVVTTTNNHNYNPGMKVSFQIPGMYGMQQLVGLVGFVAAVTSNTLTININSTNFTPFVVPSLPRSYSLPYVVPYASGPYLPPQPLPYGNENSFEGTIYNNGAPGDPVNGV
jgi:hypothetical protein